MADRLKLRKEKLLADIGFGLQVDIAEKITTCLLEMKTLHNWKPSQGRERLNELSRRPGWFPTAGQLLDWLRARREASSESTAFLPAPEWRRMQWRFAIDLGSRRLRRRKGTRTGWETG